MPDARPLIPRALALGVALLLGVTLPVGAEERPVQVLTVDGAAVEGTLVGGVLSVKTAAGVRAIEARHITTFTGTLLKLDSGLSFMGSLEVAGGEVLVQTAEGEVVVPGRTIRSIQSGQVLVWSSPSSPASGGTLDTPLAPQALVGRWRDSSGMTWEFLDDGTLIVHQLAGRYRIVGPRQVAVEFGLFLVQGARVYDILSLDRDLLVWASQGNQAKLIRQK